MNYNLLHKYKNIFNEFINKNKCKRCQSALVLEVLNNRRLYCNSCEEYSVIIDFKADIVKEEIIVKTIKI